MQISCGRLIWFDIPKNSNDFELLLVLKVFHKGCGGLKTLTKRVELIHEPPNKSFATYKIYIQSATGYSHYGFIQPNHIQT